MLSQSVEPAPCGRVTSRSDWVTKMTRITAIIVAVLGTATFMTSISQARVADHRATKRVCAEGSVERAPASRPIAPAYPGDRFTITRPTLKVVHHSDGSVERFADGYLTHRDTRSGKTFRHDGWISTRILAGGRACP
jgi:hypothetical protein